MFVNELHPTFAVSGLTVVLKAHAPVPSKVASASRRIAKGMNVLRLNKRRYQWVQEVIW